jgi:hypothetical protein
MPRITRMGTKARLIRTERVRKSTALPSETWGTARNREKEYGLHGYFMTNSCQATEHSGGC